MLQIYVACCCSNVVDCIENYFFLVIYIYNTTQILMTPAHFPAKSYRAARSSDMDGPCTIRRQGEAVMAPDLVTEVVVHRRGEGEGIVPPSSMRISRE